MKDQHLGQWSAVTFNSPSPRLLHAGAAGERRRTGAVSAWEKVRAEGVCRLCLRPDAVRPLTRHHLIPQRDFRPSSGHPVDLPQESRPLPVDERNRAANVVPLCEPCHRRVDSNKGEADRRHARRELRRCLSQTEVAFVVELRGLPWLDRHYPRYESGKEVGSPVRE